MTITQISFDFENRHQRQQRGANYCIEVKRCLRQLANTGQRWATAEQIAHWLGWPWCEQTRRRITLAVESAGAAIIGSRGGEMRGYCLAEYATREELLHAAATLRAQAREELAKAIAIERWLHKGTEI